MIIKFLQNILIFFLVLIIEVAVLPNIPGVSEYLNFALVVIIFMAASYEYYVGLIYALVIGLCLEMYSALPYGLIIIALLLTLVFVNFVSKHILTNKSFYSLLGQIFIATIVYSIIFGVYRIVFILGVSQVALLLESNQLMILSRFLGQVLVNASVASFLFLVFHVSSRRYKAVFIDTTKA